MRRFLRLIALSCLLALTACGTLCTLSEPQCGPFGPYSGTKASARGHGTQIDIPFSLVFDTILLPVSIPAAAVRRAKQRPLPSALTRALPDVVWSSEQLRIDIDCDGRRDAVFAGRTPARYVVAAVVTQPEGAPTVSYVTFALAGESQDSLCARPLPLRQERLDYDPIELVFDTPEGFIRSSRCFGMQLRSGDCDSFHLYWNHSAKKLDWWRL